MSEPDPGGSELSDADRALFARLGAWIAARRLETPAVLFLETMRPLSFVGAQGLYFLEPFARAIFDVTEYERLARLLERRSNLELLVRAIEDAADTRESQARAHKGRKADDA